MICITRVLVAAFSFLSRVNDLYWGSTGACQPHNPSPQTKHVDSNEHTPEGMHRASASAHNKKERFL